MLKMKPHLQIALALIWRGGEVLVAKRPSDAEHLPDVWEFPGGKVEAGESPSAAAMREAREETGLEIEILGAREPIEWEYELRRVTLHPFDNRVSGGKLRGDWRFVAVESLEVENFPAANRALIAAMRIGKSE